MDFFFRSKTIKKSRRKIEKNAFCWNSRLYGNFFNGILYNIEAIFSLGGGSTNNLFNWKKNVTALWRPAVFSIWERNESGNAHFYMRKKLFIWEKCWCVLVVICFSVLRRDENQNSHFYASADAFREASSPAGRGGASFETDENITI